MTTTAQVVAFCGVVALVATVPVVLTIIRPAHPGAADTLTLSLIAVAITLLWSCTVANLVAVFRRLFARSAVRRTLGGLSGAALLGLGLRLALSRP